MTPNSFTAPASRLGPLIALPVILAAAVAAVACGPGDAGHRQAVLFAATVCLAGSLGAWLVGRQPATTPAGRVTSALAAMALRLFPALVALAWLQTGGAAIRAAGGGELLVFFYLAALAADLVQTIVVSSRVAQRPGTDKVI
ncbi:MAG: hypothetical protein ACR2IT_13560 [Pirellulales bacterium]